MTLQQMSDRALLTLHAENQYGAKPEPDCNPAGPSGEWAWLALGVFIVLFLGTHLAWLLARAYNKAMDRLS
ncbi:hypothetical protein QCE62_09555 [Caballeronia sp. LZ033]|uniref:hypothetical protein n=1 Tax=Caballeronia sp. LZ033 TaxID=3038566 RepID=UPI0028568493|nr:hypothetical protein [Caballeronia sp. LZ033]MDR5813830.1 hypothetical protein [Caballeronia sp. LZ033]